MTPKAVFRIKNAAYFLSVFALLSAILAFMSTISMGFPDGHLTEFERATKPLLIWYSIVALLFGILFYGLARFSSKTYSSVVFYFSLGIFVVLVIGLSALYFYLGSNLDHGRGG